MAKEQIKLQQKELEGNDAEKAKAEQVTYDAGMTKTTQSLTAQLRDVARAFYLEVWGEAINAIVVGVESKSFLIETLEEYDAGIGHPVGGGGSKGHCIGFVNTGIKNFLPPFVELCVGILENIFF